ncbi:DUF2199 domain-containing protein [Roseibium suaedae]|uniref:DUF2199 domain-containing protein n=1 Tax=Roseibium suaedae TaxID=735517 RepID=A0A1M7MBD0_9HYPH|nr:DUF2199 domain-containing protein [Roseibium suaedae]SHM88137.1 hypothetical protein SAMN05444272_3338 [Roseibium suaedae]
MIIAIDPNKRKFSFKCACCGNIHEGGPSFSYDKPFEYFGVPDEDRESCIRINSDLCVINESVFLIRTTLAIPILETDDDFLWGVWVSQSKESFDRYVDTYETDQSGDVSFGWLNVRMPGYTANDAEPVYLAVDVHWGPDRPELVFHQHENHQLAIDQREGISWDKAVELATLLQHPPSCS